MGVAGRVPVIAGNWKMNKTVGDAVALAQALKADLTAVKAVEVVVCPTFTSLHAVGQELKGSSIAMGGQNCYREQSGAFTGEISPQMLLDVGCQWTIIGHSERRQIFLESDELLNEKLLFALESGLKVMFCVGETLEERESGDMNAVLERQVVQGLDGLEDAQFKQVVVAYEPVWAIGTGVTASPEQAQEAHDFVRGLVEDNFGEAVAKALRIQYGGSVKPQNAAELISRPDVDGFLIGGASLKASDFVAIVEAAAG